MDTKDPGHVVNLSKVEDRPRLYPMRLLLVLGVIFTLTFGVWWLKKFGLGSMPLQCFFHRFTGLHCPGCGMTRATASVLEFDALAAFRYNPLGVILFPVAMFGVALETIGWVRGTAPPWRIPLGKHGAKIIAVVVILFFILRNFPWYPFCLLAPH